MISRPSVATFVAFLPESGDGVSGADSILSGGGQAALRSRSALRLAMKAARRGPRAQGITVLSSAAVATTDLMKRVLVFMSVPFALSSGRRVCRC